MSGHLIHFLYRILPGKRMDNVERAYLCLSKRVKVFVYRGLDFPI